MTRRRSAVLKRLSRPERVDASERSSIGLLKVVVVGEQASVIAALLYRGRQNDRAV